ncbi:MAG: hypothetical protein J6Y65_00735 [Eggerthellaceae bacterium]|nr:hypothetical protein [Eggerthellaceae bacterium]
MNESLRQSILDMIQADFPLESHPYRVIADALGSSEEECFDAVRQLIEDKAIRRIGASFSSKHLGYVSTLCAFAVENNRLDEVASIVNACPNVTHNYGRDNKYNLWFTLIARNKEELQSILCSLSNQAQIKDVLDLPATKMFKINVDFSNVSNKANRVVFSKEYPFDANDAFDVALVGWAQGNIALCGLEPYAEGARFISKQIGTDIDEARLIRRLNELKANGTVRRFGAMVAHINIGYAFNAMTVWATQDESLGKAFADAGFVSHCYMRPSTSSWPYTLYAMVHATTQEELEARINILKDKAMNTAGEIPPFDVLTTTKEYKKISMKYF